MNSSPLLRFILSDLDGVIRKFPKSRDQAIETKFGLVFGSLAQSAFEKTDLLRAITGKISDQEWRHAIARRLVKLNPAVDTQFAFEEWSNFPGEVDFEFLAAVDEIFSKVPIALLTNATSRLNHDLASLKLSNRFHRIFNSSEIGFCKPDRSIFEHVVESLECLPSEILFIDDSIPHVAAAKSYGLQAFHYTSTVNFQKQFRERRWRKH